MIEKTTIKRNVRKRKDLNRIGNARIYDNMWCLLAPIQKIAMHATESINPYCKVCGTQGDASKNSEYMN